MLLVQGRVSAPSSDIGLWFYATDPQSVASNYTDCKLIGYKYKAHIDEARGRQR